MQITGHDSDLARLSNAICDELRPALAQAFRGRQCRLPTVEFDGLIRVLDGFRTSIYADSNYIGYMFFGPDRLAICDPSQRVAFLAYNNPDTTITKMVEALTTLNITVRV